MHRDKPSLSLCICCAKQQNYGKGQSGQASDRAEGKEGMRSMAWLASQWGMDSVSGKGSFWPFIACKRIQATPGGGKPPWRFVDDCRIHEGSRSQVNYGCRQKPGCHGKIATPKDSLSQSQIPLQLGGADCSPASRLAPAVKYLKEKGDFKFYELKKVETFLKRCIIT